MELDDRVVVVTGGASGIGRALCRRFAVEGARAVVVADFNADGARAVAAELNQGDSASEPTTRALAVPTDVSREPDVIDLVERTESTYGPIDLFCSNAGIAVGGGAEAPDEDWDRIWRINVLAHIYAARAVLPGMIARGEGYLLNTASAAGLLTNLGAAPYAVTKHAAVALAEWLAITHGDAGIKVSCLCPQGVRTAMLLGGLDPSAAEGGDQGFPPGQVVLASGEMLEPEDVADAVVEGLRAETFLILPHPEVAEYFRHKAADYDRWLRGMRRLQQRLIAGG
ncbi:MAG TPA: SDR family oxidoreductase [Acidimicrobiales bacterium]|nr:SDR family oxidoreductase [Acidimicrobiales bacterium]